MSECFHQGPQKLKRVPTFVGGVVDIYVFVGMLVLLCWKTEEFAVDVMLIAMKLDKQKVNACQDET
jgi:hypothetical protein